MLLNPHEYMSKSILGISLAAWPQNFNLVTKAWWEILHHSLQCFFNGLLECMNCIATVIEVSPVKQTSGLIISSKLGKNYKMYYF